jgi:hypothetical protein
MVGCINVREYGRQHTRTWIRSAAYTYVNKVSSIHVRECDQQHTRTWMWSAAYTYVNMVSRIHVRECDQQHTRTWIWSAAYTYMNKVSSIHVREYGQQHASMWICLCRQKVITLRIQDLDSGPHVGPTIGKCEIGLSCREDRFCYECCYKKK